MGPDSFPQSSSFVILTCKTRKPKEKWGRTFLFDVFGKLGQ